VAGLLLSASLGGSPTALSGQSLRGSPASLDRQNRVAHEHDFTYLRNARRVRYFAQKGWLVRIRPNRDLTLHAVSYPYARPEVKVFLSRLAAQYRAACGEKLVVTSLTRPISRQPGNASERSVHPTGMAADLRFSHNRRCRSWLERVLLSLEKARVVEATREHYPAHYHVAVFPREYASYVASLQRRQATRMADAGITSQDYQVRSGDTLWTIARRHNTTVAQLRSLNNLRTSRIYAGQVIEIPTGQ
jgi:hypothetical protein